MYKAGTTLRLDFGTYFHYGISDGKGSVIHNSKKYLKVTKESEEKFAEGKNIQLSDISSQDPDGAVVRAKQYLEMPYNLISNNCEHFVRLAHGLEVESTQIKQYLVATLGVGVAIKSENHYVQAAGSAIALSTLLTPIEENPLKNAAIATTLTLAIVALAKE